MSIPITLVIHHSSCAISLMTNIILATLIVKKTPPKMRIYSIILLNLVYIESTTAIASFLVFVKILSTDVYLLDAFTGPCRFSGFGRLCFSLYAVVMHGHSHHIVLVAFCVCFRLYAIRVTLPSVSIKRILITLFLVYLPTVAVLSYFATSELLDEQILQEVWHSAHPCFNYSEGALLVGSRMSFFSISFGTFWVRGMMIPVTLTISVCGFLIHRTLSSKLTMSEHSKRLHREIIRGLFFQSLLLVLHLFAVLAYKLRQFGVISDSEEFGYSTTMFGSITVAISPLITLFSIRPYRRSAAEFLLFFVRKKKIHPTETFAAIQSSATS